MYISHLRKLRSSSKGLCQAQYVLLGEPAIKMKKYNKIPKYLRIVYPFPLAVYPEDSTNLGECVDRSVEVLPFMSCG